MEQKVKGLIAKLKGENSDRGIALNDKNISEYEHTVLVHKYNNTLEIIKQLEQILK